MRKTENGYVVCCGVDMLFFKWMVRKAWDYEKSVPGAQIAPIAWGILQLVVSLNVAIALAVLLGVFGNWIKYFDRR